MYKFSTENALKFATYERIKVMMEKEGEILPTYQRFLAGSLAGFIASSTVYPMVYLFETS